MGRTIIMIHSFNTSGLTDEIKTHCSTKFSKNLEFQLKLLQRKLNSMFLMAQVIITNKF